MKAASEATDYIKQKAHQLITDKNEEIVLHNDVIRSTTLYDSDGTLIIRQNEVPTLKSSVVQSELKQPDPDFWETNVKNQDFETESVKGTQDAGVDQTDVNII